MKTFIIKNWYQNLVDIETEKNFLNHRRQIFDIYVSKQKIWLPSIELINLGPILDAK